MTSSELHARYACLTGPLSFPSGGVSNCLQGRTEVLRCVEQGPAIGPRAGRAEPENGGLPVSMRFSKGVSPPSFIHKHLLGPTVPRLRARNSSSSVKAVRSLSSSSS